MYNEIISKGINKSYNYFTYSNYQKQIEDYKNFGTEKFDIYTYNGVAYALVNSKFESDYIELWQSRDTKHYNEGGSHYVNAGTYKPKEEFEIAEGQANAIYHGLGKSTVKRVEKYGARFLEEDDYYESESKSNYENLKLLFALKKRGVAKNFVITLLKVIQNEEDIKNWTLEKNNPSLKNYLTEKTRFKKSDYLTNGTLRPFQRMRYLKDHEGGFTHGFRAEYEDRLMSILFELNQLGYYHTDLMITPAHRSGQNVMYSDNDLVIVDDFPVRYLSLEEYYAKLDEIKQRMTQQEFNEFIYHVKNIEPGSDFFDDRCSVMYKDQWLWVANNKNQQYIDYYDQQLRNPYPLPMTDLLLNGRDVSKYKLYIPKEMEDKFKNIIKLIDADNVNLYNGNLTFAEKNLRDSLAASNLSLNVANNFNGSLKKSVLEILQGYAKYNVFKHNYGKNKQLVELLEKVESKSYAIALIKMTQLTIQTGNEADMNNIKNMLEITPITGRSDKVKKITTKKYNKVTDSSFYITLEQALQLLRV
ncbi:hypothetical protein [Allofrancisella frigidaquae]|uniref:Uncharacterized protein n=1 Tax=Allofrancisella frigidaquae TaxID=1085644 RepID=A0A6M3HVC2_9GAMM|nr:hypothetical protein [Allofrancisella frigidaquae]QIV95138.1 hypothetical protein E3E15_07180 [Allofrancisella frigidaquae]